MEHRRRPAGLLKPADHGRLAAYEANSNRLRRSLQTSINKKAAFGELRHCLSRFANYLEGNLKVPDEELELMGLHPHHKRSPLPKPNQPPVLSVVRKRDELILYISREEHGQPTRSVRPASYYGIKLRWCFEDETVWRTEISTHLRLTLSFGCEDETRRIVMAAAWMNPPPPGRPLVQRRYRSDWMKGKSEE